jgi:hypothetical protein
VGSKITGSDAEFIDDGVAAISRLREQRERDQPERRLVVDVASRLYAAWIITPTDHFPTMEEIVKRAIELIAEVDDARR